MRDLTVGVLGATGLVGREMVSVLAERGFPAARLHVFSSREGAGQEILYRGEKLRAVAIGESWWRGIDVALLATDEEVSRREAPPAAASGTLVVDNSSAFRLESDVPLVVPEVNGAELRAHRGIVANPNCSAIQLVLALAPLDREVGITRVVLSTYQSVSGAGAAAERALREEVRAFQGGGAPARDPASPFPRPIAFNLFPHIGSFDSEGWCGEENKIRAETRKILHRPDLAVVATVVRVPVFRVHCQSVMVECRHPVSAPRVREILACAPGLILQDEPQRAVYPTPLERAGKDAVSVGRIRSDPDLPHAIHFWVVGDNLRKGAALNAVQIAEVLAFADPAGAPPAGRRVEEIPS